LYLWSSDARKWTNWWVPVLIGGHNLPFSGLNRVASNNSSGSGSSMTPRTFFR
jgi:hypothetical protein